MIKKVLSLLWVCCIVSCGNFSKTEDSSDSNNLSDSNDTFIDGDTSSTDSHTDPEPPRATKWVLVDAGTFVFGSPVDIRCQRSVDREDEVSVSLTHKIVVSETEVTQYQWQQAGLVIPPQYVNLPNLPVVFVIFMKQPLIATLSRDRRDLKNATICHRVLVNYQEVGMCLNRSIRT